MTEKTNQHAVFGEDEKLVKPSLVINLKDNFRLMTLNSKMPRKFGLTHREGELLTLVDCLDVEELFTYISEDEKTAFLLSENSTMEGYKLKYKKISFEKLLEYDLNIILNTDIKDVSFKDNNIVASNQSKEYPGKLHLTSMENSIFVIGGYINSHKLKQGESCKPIIEPKELVVKGVNLLRSFVGLDTKRTNFEPSNGSVINFYNSCVENIFIFDPKKIERIEIFNSFLNKVFLMGAITAFKSENSDTSFFGANCKIICIKNIRRKEIDLCEHTGSWENTSFHFENNFISTSTVNIFSPYKAFLAAGMGGVHVCVQEREVLGEDKSLFIRFNLTEEEIKELLIEFHSELIFPVAEMKHNFINALLCEINSMFLAHKFMVMNKTKY